MNYQGGTYSYESFCQILRHLIIDIETEPWGPALIREYAGSLFELLPELADKEYFSKKDRQVHSDGEGMRVQLLEEISGFFQQIGKRRPVVLFIEDLHWAGEATLELFAYLARSLSEEKIILCATYRTEEKGEAIDGRDFQEVLQEIPGLQWITLSSLNKLQVGRMLDSMTGMRGGMEKDLHENIYMLTKGNPFYCVELARLLEKGDDQDLFQTRKVLKSMPANVREIIRSKLRYLDRETIRVLQYGALLGREFDGYILERIFSDGETVQRSLDKALQMGVIEIQGGQRNRYNFYHDLLRYEIRAQIPEKKREQYHRDLAVVIEGLAINERLKVDLLAYHYYEGKIEDKAVQYMFKAGVEANQVYDHEKAIGYFQKVAGLNKDPVLAEDLDRELGIACSYSDRRKESIKCFRRYLKSKKIIQNPKLVRESSFTREKEIEKIIDSINILSHGYLCYKNLKAGRWFAEKALFLAKVYNYKKGQINALNNISVYYLYTGDFKKASKFLKLCMNQAEGGFYCHLFYKAMAYLLNINRNMGILRKSESLAGVLEREVVFIKDIITKYHIYSKLAFYYEEIGQLKKGMELQQKSFEAVEKTGDKRVHYSIYNNIAVNLLWQGKIEEADHYLEKSNEMRVEKDNSLKQFFNLNKAEILLKKHKFRDAISFLLKAYKFIKKTNTNELLSDFYELLGTCHLQLNELDTAEIYCRKLLANSITLPQKRYIGRSYLLKANICAKQNKTEAAKLLFQKTLNLFSRSGYLLEYTETLLQYGRFWMELGDTVNAGRNLKKSLSMFKKLDLEHHMKRVYIDLIKLQEEKVRPDFKVLTEAERFFRKWDFQKELKILQEVRNKINRKKSDREKHLWQIFQVTQTLCRFDNLNLLSEEIVSQANKLFKADKCILVIPGAGGLEIKTAGDVDPDIREVFLHGESSGEESKKVKLDTKMDGFQSIPLVLDERILGMIYISNTIRAYHMKNLKVFARLAAVAIQNALTRENLMRENVILRNG